MFDSIQQQRRFEQFPDELRHMFYNNTTAHRLMTMFCRGEIWTMEELMFQLVTQLYRELKDLKEARLTEARVSARLAMHLGSDLKLPGS